MFANGEVLIQKYGGSSMGSAERIRKAAARIAKRAFKGYPMVVVVSAMGDTTDDLISLMGSITSNPSRRELDSVMATGEIVSASLMACALSDLGIKAKSYNAFNLGLYTELQGEDYNIVDIGRKQELCDFLRNGEKGNVAVVAGFQGITREGDFTTLGRGGSDLTAVVMARALGQKVCEKYTDEDGIYTADPRILPDASKVWHLNYSEMLELAKSGNGILHPRAISTAKESEIRIHVRSSFSKEEGSVIGPDGDRLIPIKSITLKKRDNDTTAISVVGSGLAEDSALVQKLIAASAGEWVKQVNHFGIRLEILVDSNFALSAISTLHSFVLEVQQ
jgi:aspartate kinase